MCANKASATMLRCFLYLWPKAQGAFFWTISDGQSQVPDGVTDVVQFWQGLAVEGYIYPQHTVVRQAQVWIFG